MSVDNQFNIILNTSIDTSKVEKQVKAVQNSLTQSVGDSAVSDKQLKSWDILDTKLRSLRDTSIITEGQFGDLSSQLNKLWNSFDAGSISVKDFDVGIENIKTSMNEARQVTSQYAIDFQDALSSLSPLANKSAKESASVFEATLGSVDKLFDNTSNELSRLLKTGKITTSQFDDLSSRLKQSYESFDNTTVGAKKFNTEVGNLKTSIAGAKQETYNATQANKSFGESLSTNIAKFTSWYLIAGVVTSIVKALKNVVKEVGKLDNAMNSLQMVTGATSSEISVLRDEYIALAKEMSVTVDTVTDGVNEYLRAGLSAKDTTDALKASLTLSTVGAMSSADATKYLVAAMNAYNLEASELMNVVDKLSAVDIVAATSSEELAEALSLSASSAQLAGIGLDEYLGMIATVSETTRKSASVVGHSFQTIFARLQQVKLGSLTDEEGEDISNVETVLKQYGIDLMKVSSNLTDMGAVLDLLGEKWKSYSSAQQSEIATVIAGTRQRENLIVLLNNYSRAMELSEVATNSAGSALEKYNIYQESTEAKLNKIKASFTELATVTLESDIIKGVLDLANAMLELSTNTGGLLNSIVMLVSITGVIKNIKTLTTSMTALASATTATQQAQLATAISSAKLGLAVAGIGIAISAVIGAYNAYQNKLQEQRETERQATDDRLNELEQERSALYDLMNEYVTVSGSTNKNLEKEIELRKKIVELLKLQGETATKFVSGESGASGAVATALFDEISTSLTSSQITTQSQLDKEKYLLSSLSQELTYSSTGSLASTGGSFGAGIADFFSKLFFGDSKKKKREEQEVLVKQYEEQINQYTSALNAIDTSKTLFTDLLNSFQSWSSGATVKNTKELESYVAKMTDNLETITDEQTKTNLQDLLSSITTSVETWKNQDIGLDWLKEQTSTYKKLLEQEEEELALQEKLLKVEKARAELAEAKNKKILVFRQGKGFVEAEDAEAVQEAQDNLTEALKDLEESEYEKKLKNLETLTETYNQALLDNQEDLRLYFLDTENLLEFQNASFERQLEILKEFVGEREKLISGDTSTSTNTSVDVSTKKLKTPIGGIKNKDVAIAIRHNGGYVGDGTGDTTSDLSLKDNEVFAKLLKGEYVLTNQMQHNIVDGIKSTESTRVINFNGDLSFPNVTSEKSAQGFIQEIIKLGQPTRLK